MKKTVQPRHGGDVPDTKAVMSPAAPPEMAFAQSPLGARLRAVLADAGESASNRAIADFLLRNPVRATAWGIEELAANAKTSAATLSRFSRSLGLSGFAALRAEMAEVLQGVLQPVEKLRGVVGRPDASSSAVSEGLSSTLGNVRGTAEGLDPRRLAQLARRIDATQTVYIVGFGLSAHIAAMLALHLQPFCRQVVNVVEYGGTEVAAGRLMNIGRQDLLFAISLPRYADDAIRLTRYARDRGAYAVAITDSMASPLAAIADETLLASAAHPVLSSSSVPALLVVEAIATSLMVSNSEHVEQAGRLTEAIAGYLHNPRESGRKRR